MLSIEERESLLKPVQPKYTGFTPRPIERIATACRPTSLLNLECQHFLRGHDAGKGQRNWSYQMWLEAGKHELPKPDRPDRSFNSAVWRQLRQHYNLETSRGEDGISDLIAGMYPINVPASSTLGDATYTKFVAETPLIKDRRQRTALMRRSVEDYRELERLRIRSEMRNPPLNKNGLILPPDSYPQNLYHYTNPLENRSKVLVERRSNEKLRVDMFGRSVPQAKSPNVWKLTYRLNNPEYEKVKTIVDSSPSSAQKPELIPPASSPLLTCRKIDEPST